MHPLAFARNFTLKQRRQNTQRGVQARAHVGHRQARAHRARARQARHRHQPTHALHDLVKAGAASQRAVLPKARNAGQNNPRVNGRQRLVVNAEFGFYVGAPIFNEHIGGFHQLHQHGTRAGFFQIQCH